VKPSASPFTQLHQPFFFASVFFSFCPGSIFFDPFSILLYAFTFFPPGMLSGPFLLFAGLCPDLTLWLGSVLFSPFFGSFSACHFPVPPSRTSLPACFGYYTHILDLRRTPPLSCRSCSSNRNSFFRPLRNVHLRLRPRSPGCSLRPPFLPSRALPRVCGSCEHLFFPSASQMLVPLLDTAPVTSVIAPRRAHLCPEYVSP